MPEAEAPAEQGDDRAGAGVMGALTLVGAVLMYLSPVDSVSNDLYCIYDGGRFAAEGQLERAYAAVDPVRAARWEADGFEDLGPSYLFAPWLAGLLAPLTGATSFATWSAGMRVTIALCHQAALAMATWWFAPAARRVTMFAVLTMWPLVAAPFRQALYHGQPHGLLMITMVVGLALSRRGWWRLGGVLLALPVAIKVSPAVSLVYALLAGWRRATWLAGAVAAVLILSGVVTMGWPVHVAWLEAAREHGAGLLVAHNNQALAATVMGPWHPDWLERWDRLPMPGWLSLLSTAGLLATTVGAGWLARQGAVEGGTLSMLLLAMVVFPPLSWGHYHLVLGLPCAWLLHLAVRDGRALPGVVAAVSMALTVSPHVTGFQLHTRQVWFASALALVAVTWETWRATSLSRPDRPGATPMS